jgi:hypothetical protein
LLEPPNTADPAPDTPLVTRGGHLQALIAANQDKSLQAFARLNKDPIPGSRTEVRVPASASTLYVYRLSAISATNVEAPRSAQVALFGVPRRNVPGTPRLLLRPSAAPPGMQLIALPVESGAVPAGYRVFRVRKATLSLDGSTMGPLKIGEADPGWQDYAGTSLAGNPISGKSIVDFAAVPSWYPYYYRLLAVGQEDLPNGEFAGESGFSAAQSALLPPAGPPLQEVFTLATNVNAALVTLTTNLPAAAKSPVGPALVEVLEFVPDPAKPGRLQAKTILSQAPDTIPVGTLKLPVAPKPPIHPLPFPSRPVPPSVPVPSLRRSAPDAAGRWKLFVLLPYATTQKNTFLVRLTDPLARESNTSF